MGTISWQKLLFSTLRHLAQSSVSSRALIYIYISRIISLWKRDPSLLRELLLYTQRFIFIHQSGFEFLYNFSLFSIYHFCVEIILIFEEEVWLTFRFDKIISTFNPLVPFRLRRKLILWIIIHFHRIFFVWTHFSFFFIIIILPLYFISKNNISSCCVKLLRTC